jgi:hypothetical protein
MRRLPGALIAVLVVQAACGVVPTSQSAPSVTATSGPTEAPASPASPGTGPNSGATPAEVSEEQQFSLDDAAEFDDGLLIEIAAVADKAARTDRGAEATNGEIVIASVRIENKTKEAYAAASVLIGAKYGNDNDEHIVIDKTDELQSGFTGTIKAGDEAIATVGFAVPFSELKRVTFIVDPNDDLHEAISFTGPVQRD